MWTLFSPAFCVFLLQYSILKSTGENAFHFFRTHNIYLEDFISHKKSKPGKKDRQRQHDDDDDGFLRYQFDFQVNFFVGCSLLTLLVLHHPKTFPSAYTHSLQEGNYYIGQYAWMLFLSKNGTVIKVDFVH